MKTGGCILQPESIEKPPIGAFCNTIKITTYRINHRVVYFLVLVCHMFDCTWKECWLAMLGVIMTGDFHVI